MMYVRASANPDISQSGGGGEPFPQKRFPLPQIMKCVG